jgi:hypothetical protein
MSRGQRLRSRTLVQGARLEGLAFHVFHDVDSATALAEADDLLRHMDQLPVPVPPPPSTTSLPTAVS